MDQVLERWPEDTTLLMNRSFLRGKEGDLAGAFVDARAACRLGKPLQPPAITETDGCNGVALPAQCGPW